MVSKVFTKTELLEIAEKCDLFSEQLLRLDNEIQVFTEEKINRPFFGNSNQKITERIQSFSTDIAEYAYSLKDISNTIRVADDLEKELENNKELAQAFK